MKGGNHLERQARLDLFLEGLSNDAVELRQDLHGELRVDALVPDQFIQRISQGSAEAAGPVSAKGKVTTKKALRKRPRLIKIAKPKKPAAEGGPLIDGDRTFHGDRDRKSSLRSPWCPRGCAATRCDQRRLKRGARGCHYCVTG